MRFEDSVVDDPRQVRSACNEMIFDGKGGKTVTVRKRGVSLRSVLLTRSVLGGLRPTGLITELGLVPLLGLPGPTDPYRCPTDGEGWFEVHRDLEVALIGSTELEVALVGYGRPCSLTEVCRSVIIDGDRLAN
ncbi:hypothetical protein U1Q18_018240 [Sarracenia purpurea var. burkii]